MSEIPMKDGWAGIHVAPPMEFAACCEAQRLGLLAYCPQRRVRIWPKGVTEPLMRAYPLFKGCLLAPLSQARDRAWHYARGVRGPKYLVEDAEGRPWTAPDAAVRELCQLERENAFDDPLPDNAVRLTGCDLLAAIAGEALASLFAPLFAAPVPRAPTKAELERELLEAGRPTPGTPVSLWVDAARIRASTAPDVLARAENYSLDDRTAAQRSADASRAHVCALAAQPVKWRFTHGARARTADLSRVG
jgi:hypothetical protein